LVNDRPEAFVPMPECIFQSSIEHMNPNVREPLDGMPIPSHLLFFDHPFRDNFIDRQLDKPCRDPLPGAVPLAAVGHGA